MESSKIQTLQQEIIQLESLLDKKRRELKQLQIEDGKSKLDLTNSEKIALYRSLFKGREDVFALRYESKKTGKSGYQPACENEWKPGVCGKPKVKCSLCPNRTLIPITDEIIKSHLQGVGSISGSRKADFVIGIYPLMIDETCYFLALDFDKEEWKQDVAAFMETCKEFKVPAYLERSRSGNGGHVWIFFKEKIQAKIARKLGSFLMTKTLDRRPEVGLDSFDRFFPNQDTMPKGGFGNLIALPLQKKVRDFGKTCFLDYSFVAIEDQWGFLNNIDKIQRVQVEEILKDSLHYGEILPVAYHVAESEEIEPWKKDYTQNWPNIETGLPKKVEVTISNEIFIDSTGLPSVLRNRILRLASFANPEFYKAQRMRLPTWDKPRILYCYEQFSQHIGIPIGCLEDLKALFTHYSIKIDLYDKRNRGRLLDVSFTGELFPEQAKAAKALLKDENGILSATTAFGKTVLALYLIAQRKVNTLILVHRKQLMDQWIDRIQQFLGLTKKEIGKFSGSSKKRTGNIDVAVIQSVFSKGEVKEWVKDYGQVIVDECHHVSAFSFEQTIRQSDAFFKLGLSATVTRKDGQHPIVQMNLGKIRYRVSAKQEAKKRSFEHLVKFRVTGLKLENKNTYEINIQELFNAVWQNDLRNKMVVEDILEAYKNRRKIILLSERKEHLNQLREMLEENISNLFLLQGGMGKKQVKHILTDLEAIEQDEGLLLLATGKYLGEGFDLPKLDTLFLTFPISWKGTLSQYAGRLHRDYYGKEKVIIYDYVDSEVPVLNKMHKRRLKGYMALGYSVDS